MDLEFAQLIRQVAESKYQRIKGSFRLKLTLNGKNYYNRYHINFYELRSFLYELKKCDNTLRKMDMIESKTHLPLNQRVFYDFRIIPKTYKRYSLWVKGTNTRAYYNDMMVPEFKRLNAAIAFNRVLLNNSTDIEVRVRKFNVAKNKEDILLSRAKQIANWT